MIDSNCYVAQKGVSAHLLTLDKKRRRTTAQIEEEGLAAQLREHMHEQLEA